MPYQANVIKMFEMVSSKIVLTRPPAQRSVSSLTPRNGEPLQSVIIHTSKQIRRGTNRYLQYGVRHGSNIKTSPSRSFRLCLDKSARHSLVRDKPVQNMPV